jgi:hypothetical protein
MLRIPAADFFLERFWEVLSRRQHIYLDSRSINTLMFLETWLYLRTRILKILLLLSKFDVFDFVLSKNSKKFIF